MENDLVENIGSILEADQVLNQVCEKAGKYLYDQYYIKPKVRPFTVKSRELTMAAIALTKEIPGDIGEKKGD